MYLAQREGAVGYLYLSVGLILLIGMHSIRLVAPDWRERLIARRGPSIWRALHTGVSLPAVALIVWGFSLASADPVWLWLPPPWTHHVTAALTVPAFVLLAAALLPGSRIAWRVGQPLAASVKLWAFGHLVANGTLAHVMLFGSLLAWAVVSYVVLRRRMLAPRLRTTEGMAMRDLVVITSGLALWAVFAFRLHGILIGVRPFG